jgi:hypothetical protein
MQTAQEGAGHNLPPGQRAIPGLLPAGYALPNTLMGPRVVEVMPVLFDYAMQMWFPQDQEMI